MALLNVKPPVIEVGGSRINNATPQHGDSLVFDSLSSLWVPAPRRRNLIINGATRIQQRGVSFAGVSTSAWPCDRWKYVQSNDGTMNVYGSSSMRPTVAQAGLDLQQSVYLDVATIDATIGAAQYAALVHVVEGWEIAAWIGKPMVFSFWVRSNKTGIYCVTFRNSGLDRSYVAEYTVNVADTWEKKIVAFTMHDGATGTWAWQNGAGLSISLVLACGSNYYTTKDAWQSGNYFGTSSQLNLLDTATNEIRFTGMQLEPGLIATPFELLTFNEELNLCRRWFQKSYRYSITPGTVDNNGMAMGVRANGGSTPWATFVPPMRAAPTTNVSYSPATGTSGQLRNYNAGADQSASIGFIGDVGMNIATGSGTNGDLLGAHWTADAEL